LKDKHFPSFGGGEGGGGYNSSEELSFWRIPGKLKSSIMTLCHTIIISDKCYLFVKNIIKFHIQNKDTAKILE
jgi:hypothetical protein